jgi:leucyl/phenylalanyl-tRNA--protein transferase
MIGVGRQPVDVIDLNHSTSVDLEQRALREPLRAKWAKWRRTAAEMLTRGPARPLLRAAVSDEGASRASEQIATLSVDPPALAPLAEGLDGSSILDAYRRGLVAEHLPDRTAWLTPARREAIAPQELRIGSPLRRLLREQIFSVSFDEDFAGVLAQCGAGALPESHLSPALAEALLSLHQEGHAHSIEVRNADGTLAGGLYGIAIGEIFFAEAKFERVKKASTLALAVLHHHLNHWGFALRSARWATPARGVHMVGRDIFQMLLDAHAGREHRIGRWAIDPALDTYAWSGRPRCACRRARNGPLPPLSAREARATVKLCEGRGESYAQGPTL